MTHLNTLRSYNVDLTSSTWATRLGQAAKRGRNSTTLLQRISILITLLTYMLADFQGLSWLGGLGALLPELPSAVIYNLSDRGTTMHGSALEEDVCTVSYLDKGKYIYTCCY